MGAQGAQFVWAGFAPHFCCHYTPLLVIIGLIWGRRFRAYMDQFKMGAEFLVIY